jgi:hypothetical protein
MGFEPEKGAFTVLTCFFPECYPCIGPGQTYLEHTKKSMTMTSKSFGAVLLFLIGFQLSWGTNYYFHPLLGKDNNEGTSAISPYRSLDQASKLTLQPGDSLFFAAGHTFFGNLLLRQIQGNPQSPVIISSYQWSNTLADPRAIIDAKGFPNALYLEDCSYVQVRDLILTANGGGSNTDVRQEQGMRCGVLVKTSQAGVYEGILLHNLLIRDIFFEDPGFVRSQEEVRTANGTQRYGWGIRFINLTEGAILKNLAVSACEVINVAHTGIKFTGRDHSIQDLRVYDNRVEKTGGPGVQMSGIKGGHIKGNFVNYSGSKDDSRKWGRGSGLWTWGSEDVVIEQNRFQNAKGPADSAGCHIDFNCRNVVVQYNFSMNNAGGFCEILGNNHNCAYRYNISVNDGHRVKGEEGAFQEGKTFWLSGYVGQKKKRHGPYNSYFYNNTIYVSKDIVSKIAVAKTAKGVLVANNIFCIEGESQAVLGDQYNPEKKGGGYVERVLFENNLYLHPDSWPEAVLIQPGDPAEGDPGFFHPGGTEITDYLPLNTALIKDQGIKIPIIPGDSIGLTIGLEAPYDILGRKIIGKPDMGAIEVE